MSKKRTSETMRYRDPAADVESRVRDLVGRMTLAEKVRQMGMVAIADCCHRGKVTQKGLKERLGNLGAGALRDLQFGPVGNAEAINEVQQYLMHKTRLGIPGLVHGETLHGYMSPGATVFSQAIGLASTWNPPLIREMAAAVALEARAQGVVQALAPDLDLARDARWGRVEETYGEDPYLAARFGVAYVKGVQGEQLPMSGGRNMVCTAKHFVGHGTPESGINLAPVAGSIRDLHTTYLPPFAAVIKEAGALSVMPSYSEYNDVPASSSTLLLTRILREELGFIGFTFSDYGAIPMLVSFHKTAEGPGEAGKQALEAGMDLEAPDRFGFGDALIAMVEQGRVAMEDVDQAVNRVLRVKFLAGLFEDPYANVARVKEVVHCAAHRKLARKIAGESIILLKNARAALPLRKDLSRIAVIGPNADAVRFGDYAVPRADAVTPLDGIRAAVSKKSDVVYAKGCEVYGSTADLTEAVEAAASSDVAVLVVGGMSDTYGGIGWGVDDTSATCGEGFDRHTLDLPGQQQALVEAVHATGTPCVVVFVNGRPYSTEWIADTIPAIVEMWYAGEEGGHALADILFGKINPSAKLPITVPRSVGHVPMYYSHKPSARGCYHQSGTVDDPGRDYVFAPPTPLYEFGHGLSYTTFKYSALRVTPSAIRPAGTATVRIDVRNAGKRAGMEVVQLYINDVVSTVTTPVKLLRGFAKISLAPGEKQTVEFRLGPEDLALLDESMNWTVESGTFEVMVGGHTKTFEVTS